MKTTYLTFEKAFKSLKVDDLCVDDDVMIKVDSFSTDNWEKDKIKKNCVICGKELPYTLERYKQYGNFCNPICFQK